MADLKDIYDIIEKAEIYGRQMGNKYDRYQGKIPESVKKEMYAEQNRTNTVIADFFRNNTNTPPKEIETKKSEIESSEKNDSLENPEIDYTKNIPRRKKSGKLNFIQKIVYKIKSWIENRKQRALQEGKEEIVNENISKGEQLEVRVSMDDEFRESLKVSDEIDFADPEQRDKYMKEQAEEMINAYKKYKELLEQEAGDKIEQMERKGNIPEHPDNGPEQ